MANAGSKGNRKKRSARQKDLYKQHPFKLLANKIARLKRHIKRNENEIRKKGRKGREIKPDLQAIKRLKALTS
jgi:hypothetical protein